MGCSGSPTLETIASSHKAKLSRDAPVVVFLPGTLASTLVDTDTGEMVWGRNDALSADPRSPAGLRRLSLPLTPVPSDVGAAPDAIRPVDALRRAHERVIGIPISLAIYEDAFEALANAGLPETEPGTIAAQGPALSVFPYDWRRSIVDAAQALGAALESRPSSASKVTLVGHSMGGVIALYYLMFGTAPIDIAGTSPPVSWTGARYVDRAILLAPPLRGSVIAVRNTVNGNKLGGPLVPTFPPAMLASHPSSFELMPRADAEALVDSEGTPLDTPLMSPETWRRMGWGLTDPRQANGVDILARGAEDGPALADARQAVLIARGAAFQRTVDRPVDPPEGLEIAVIAGQGEDTPKSVAIPETGGDVLVYHEADGDGTVLLSSAIAGFEDAETHPRKRVVLVDAGHMRIASNPAAFQVILDLLTAD